jgi:hypothetical protein
VVALSALAAALLSLPFVAVSLWIAVGYDAIPRTVYPPVLSNFLLPLFATCSSA